MDKIIDDFIKVLGVANVIIDDTYLSIAEQTTYYTWQNIKAILYPSDIDELKECVAISNQYLQPIYVVSKGKNWGYGSKVPIETNSVLIDLSKMNQILDYNEKFGFVTVEPGVTFNQLFEFLRNKNSDLILSTTGSSGDSSVVGNALERGIGTGIYADRFNTVCGMEILLPNGNIIKSGFENDKDNIIGKMYKYGVGPYIDGLFTQSNLGIVTKLTLWLNPTPSFFDFIFYKVNNKEKLKPLIDLLQSLLFTNTIRPTITVYNDVRIISAAIQFPFNAVQPGDVDPELLMKNIRSSSELGNMIGDWNGEISIRSENKEIGNLQTLQIIKQIQDFVDDITVIHLTKDEILQSWITALNQKKQMPTSLKNFLIKKYTGIPDETPIRQTYWRKRKPIPETLDPDKDKCGMIWISPVIPFTGNDVETAIKIISDTIKLYKFEPAISLQCMSERCINIIASFNWDREIKEEETQAIECYNHLNELLTKQGFFSYRNTTLQMQNKQTPSQTKVFLKSIKSAVDPNNILAPGKYTI